MKKSVLKLVNGTDKLRITSHPNPDSYDIAISTNPYISIYLEELSSETLKEIVKKSILKSHHTCEICGSEDARQSRDNYVRVLCKDCRGPYTRIE